MSSFLSFHIVRHVGLLLTLALGLAARPVTAGVDHPVSQNTGGIYGYSNVPLAALFLTSIGGALYLGSGDRLGRTSWQSSEAFFINGIATEALKRATGRLRPSETGDPHQWHKDGSSFPSGHVSSTAAMVTPFILEYRQEHPAVWGLAVLPAYEMVARVRQRAHWQSDVLAGAALGIAVGYVEHARGPLVLRLLPGGAYLGLQKTFD